MNLTTPIGLAIACLQQGEPAVLLQVVQSAGSSPGRQGFRMVVGPGEQMAGSIGGGIMEHKLVELACDLMRRKSTESIIKRQVHRAEETTNRSGMICSGEQTVLLYPILPEHLPQLLEVENNFEKHTKGFFRITPSGINIYSNESLPARYRYNLASDEEWSYEERFDTRETLHLIGGGHVALACSEIICKLGFRITLYDDRPDLNTFLANNWVDHKIVTPYRELGNHIKGGDDQYVAIMTFGYRTDDIAVRQLLNKPLRYLGLMGSVAKIEKLLEGLRNDEFPEGQLNRLHSPIGVQIHSKTPMEIAVSVAAELIKVRNRPD